MLIYCFKVALDGNKRIYRYIEILGRQTLADLHKTIFSAFDRYDDHLYSFFITEQPIKNIRKRYDFPEYTSPYGMDDDVSFPEKRKQNAVKTEIKELGINAKDTFYYLFDFGDEWWHEITLLSVLDAKATKGYPKIAKIVGESPDQYSDDDDDEEW